MVLWYLDWLMSIFDSVNSLTNNSDKTAKQKRYKNLN